jgi:hypothetical protein
VAGTAWFWFLNAAAGAKEIAVSSGAAITPIAMFWSAK